MSQIYISIINFFFSLLLLLSFADEIQTEWNGILCKRKKNRKRAENVDTFATHRRQTWNNVFEACNWINFITKLFSHFKPLKSFNKILWQFKLVSISRQSIHWNLFQISSTDLDSLFRKKYFSIFM